MEELMKKFERIGARVAVRKVTDSFTATRRETRRRRRDGTPGFLTPVRVDVRQDELGEYFDVRHRQDVQVHVLDLSPRDRHLLLGVHAPAQQGEPETDSAFLCGFDERSWFVAAIPENAGARNVQQAKDALKPDEVWAAMRQFAVPMHERDLRETAAFIRQGEWFFVPRPKLVVRPQDVLHDEPVQRGAGKPHVCQYLHRRDGEWVWVSDEYPNGLTRTEFELLRPSVKERITWRTMMRGARAHARGAVRHPDHETIWLKTWHEVVMNTETRSRAMAHVAFLD
jgi:hypothetical protein